MRTSSGAKQILFVALMQLIMWGCAENGHSGDASNVQFVQPGNQDKVADVIIIGAGISGLSAAIEAAERGLSVLVVDTASVFGGHAVLAAGVLNIPDTPFQESRGISDSAELAYADFVRWGEDVNEPWVEYYVSNARTDIYDWLTGLGIEFVALAKPAGNSVPRVHVPAGSGIVMISAIYRRALSQENIKFRWNTVAESLVVRDGQVVGINASDVRSGEALTYYASAIVVATGGFQSNIQRVLENWPSTLEKPTRILAGSGMHSQGSGLEMAQEVGATIDGLEKQWNYITGLPNPASPDGSRGLSFFPVPGKPRFDVWLNDDGLRFTNECASPKFNLPKVLQQPNQRYWSVFDSQNLPNMTISGPGWTAERLQSQIYENNELASVSQSLEGLALEMQIPLSVVKESIGRYNEALNTGEDKAFGRFDPRATTNDESCRSPRKIEVPPFYAVRLYPLARKSMGGIQIDLQTRILDTDGNPIAGLYAVGEVTGLAGINGTAALEGTFLGPSIVTGRVAGRSLGQHLSPEVRSVGLPLHTQERDSEWQGSSDCRVCHDLESETQRRRSGYEHFELAHQLVLTNNFPCQTCHSDFYTDDARQHSWKEQSRVKSCVICHSNGD